MWNPNEESSKFDWKDEDISLGILEFLDILQEGRSLVINKVERLKQKNAKVGEAFIRFGIENIIVTPVLQIEGDFQEILGIYNMDYKWTSAKSRYCEESSKSRELRNIHWNRMAG